MFTVRDLTIDTVVSCLKLGACDYIQKPYEKEDFLHRVKRCLLLDSTIANYMNDSTIIISQPISDNRHLESIIDSSEKEKRAIMSDYDKEKKIFELKISELNLRTKIGKLIVSISITILFYYLNILEQEPLIFIFPLALFILLSIPIENIETFYGKFKSISAKIKLKKG